MAPFGNQGKNNSKCAYEHSYTHLQLRVCRWLVDGVGNECEKRRKWVWGPRVSVSGRSRTNRTRAECTYKHSNVHSSDDWGMEEQEHTRNINPLPFSCTRFADADIRFNLPFSVFVFAQPALATSVVLASKIWRGNLNCQSRDPLPPPPLPHLLIRKIWVLLISA